MPKVTDEYLTDKKNFILQCTAAILKEKPLYLITMRDIIKKAGFSHGVIYRYYANIDEIYVDLINKNTTYDLLEQKIDMLLISEQREKDILSQCIMAMGEYVQELLNSVGGKTCFELLMTYTHDFEKRETIFPQLKFKQSLEYAQNKIVEYTVCNVERGVFTPQIPMNAIVMFASVCIDGIVQHVATNSPGDSQQGIMPVLDVSEMFRTLAKAMISFLEA